LATETTSRTNGWADPQVNATLTDSRPARNVAPTGPGDTVWWGAQGGSEIGAREAALQRENAARGMSGFTRVSLGVLAVLTAGGCLLLTDLPGALLDQGLGLLRQKTEEALLARDLQRLHESKESFRSRLHDCELRRENLAARLAALQRRRAEADLRGLDPPPSDSHPSTCTCRIQHRDRDLTAYLESERERALLDVTVATLNETLTRADLELNRLRIDLETRTTELMVLQAGADRRSLDLSLSAIEDPRADRERLGRAARLLVKSESTPDLP
jgi:hypothetical protein